MAYRDMEIDVFLSQLSSKASIPGGGGAAALCGALGAALGCMVSNLTVGKKKYADVESEITDILNRLTALRDEFLNLTDEDAKAFAPLAAAYAIPKDDPQRESIMEECLKNAAMPPFKIMETSAQALEMTAVLAEKGSVMAVSDAGCAASLLKSAMYCALLNVKINTKSMADREYAEKINEKANALMEKYGVIADDVMKYVSERLV